MAAVTLVFAAPVLAAGPHEPPSSALPAILSAAGDYLASYERELAAVVAEETYLQDIRFENRSRRLRSDLLVLQDPHIGWLGFRDVFEVDGRPVRNRSARLTDLFLKPSRKPQAQALRIVREGTRYNLSPRRLEFRRTINMPLIPLYFLRRQNQSRSTFHVNAGHPPTADGAIVVGFSEREHPRVIATPDGAAATGAFWIEPDSGRVTAAIVTIVTRNISATIHVTFAEHPALGLWLPASMDEEYHVGSLGTIAGRADYSNFRRFRVDTSMELDEPGRTPAQIVP